MTIQHHIQVDADHLEIFQPQQRPAILSSRVKFPQLAPEFQAFLGVFIVVIERIIVEGIDELAFDTNLQVPQCLPVLYYKASGGVTFESKACAQGMETSDQRALIPVTFKSSEGELF